MINSILVVHRLPVHVVPMHDDYILEKMNVSSLLNIHVQNSKHQINSYDHNSIYLVHVMEKNRVFIAYSNIIYMVVD